MSQFNLVGLLKLRESRVDETRAVHSGLHFLQCIPNADENIHWCCGKQGQL